MVTINFKKLHADAIIPSYAHRGDAGMDLHAREDYTLRPGERRTFAIGLQAAFPEGYVGLVRDRSGLAGNHGIITLAGVIDAHYRGEYKVTLLNTSQEEYTINKGDRIAQLLLIPVAHAKINVTEGDLEATVRGAGGYGSTGR